MQKQTNETIQSIQHLDSLKAVKVAIDMNELQDITIQKLIDLINNGIIPRIQHFKLLDKKIVKQETHHRKFLNCRRIPFHLY